MFENVSIFLSINLLPEKGKGISEKFLNSIDGEEILEKSS